jgi:hypothetical protein
LEWQRILDQATQVGNDYHLQKSSVNPEPLEREAKDPGVPTVAQVFPRTDLGCDPQSEADKCTGYHFIQLTIEGLRRGRVKPLNYSQVATVQQGPDEFPMAFLQCLKEAVTEHTTVDPELQVGEVLLRDKFLIQVATDIHRKFQKLVAEGGKMLGQLVQTATSVYYNWDPPRSREKDRRHYDLVALREIPF